MDGFMYSMAENGGISTLYVSPVPFEGLNEAVEKGPGRPHLGKAQRKMKKTYPMSESIDNDKSLVKRHSIIVLVEHWAIAISGLALILTGLFGLPIARRYFITEISELRWSGDYIFSLYLHYAASVVFVGASLFHVVYHGLMVHRAMLPKGGVTSRNPGQSSIPSSARGRSRPWRIFRPRRCQLRQIHNPYHRGKHWMPVIPRHKPRQRRMEAHPGRAPMKLQRMEQKAPPTVTGASDPYRRTGESTSLLVYAA